MKIKVKKMAEGGATTPKKLTNLDENAEWVKQNYPELDKTFKEVATAERASRVPRSPSGGAGGSDDLVKAMNRPYKIGGKVRTASQRADGIAQKGKTRA